MHSSGDGTPLKSLKIFVNGPIGGLIYEGRELKFCCAPCIAKFQANPQRSLTKLP